jgi:uncharacterized Fe-S cluster-containing protein
MQMYVNKMVLCKIKPMDHEEIAIGYLCTSCDYNRAMTITQQQLKYHNINTDRENYKQQSNTFSKSTMTNISATKK